MDKQSHQAQQKINQVFLELLQEKGFSQVKVSEIVRRSHINRSTFYDYYLDKYDLLDQLQARLLDKIKTHSLEAREKINQSGFEQSDMQAYLLAILDLIQEEQDSFQAFLADDLRFGFQEQFKKTFQDIWYSNLESQNQVQAQFQDYLSAGTSALLAELLSVWIRKNQPETKEDFAQTLMTFLRALYTTMDRE